MIVSGGGCWSQNRLGKAARALLARLVEEKVIAPDMALRILRPRSVAEAAQDQTWLCSQLGESNTLDVGALPTLTGTLHDEAVEGDAVVAAQASPPVDRYRLDRLVGRGGGGGVWLALDRVLERQVAVKVLHPDVATDGAARDRFVYESRVTGRLNHPGIIAIHDAGTLPDGQLFYTMPLMGGRSLRAIIAGLSQGEEATVRVWTLGRLLLVFVQTCMAVAYAHDHGVIQIPEGLARVVGPGGKALRPLGGVRPPGLEVGEVHALLIAADIVPKHLRQLGLGSGPRPPTRPGTIPGPNP